MCKKLIWLGLLALTAFGNYSAQGKTQLIIESWRNDDLKIWRVTIIPADTKKHPDIEFVFSPNPPPQYNARLADMLKPRQPFHFTVAHPLHTPKCTFTTHRT